MRAPRCLLVAVLALMACKPADAGTQEPDSPTSSTPGQVTTPQAIPASEPLSGDQAAPAAVSRPENTIFRSELDRATHGGKPAYLLAQLGPEPYRPGNRFIGWKITSVWPADPDLCGLGCDLAPGDVILTVNGKTLERPEQLSALMADISTVDQLRVKSLRDGKMRDRTYMIAED